MAGERFTIILTHEHTDFDALASMLAVHKLHPDATPLLPRTLNRNLRDFLALYRSALPFRAQEELPRRKVDRAIVVDTQSFATVKGMRRATSVQFIDHHPLQRELEEGWTYWGGETGATTTLLVEQLAERQSQLSAVEATLMLLGIYEDTGSLVYLSTTARDLRAAAWLLERGANLQVAQRFLHHSLTPEQARLYSDLADNSHIYSVAGHTVVIASARALGFHDEISTLAHKLRDVYDPDGLFLVVDLEDRIQVVARSTAEGVDVSEVTRRLGGGGHARAAAAMLREGSSAAVEAEIVRILHETVRPSLTVGQIMTLGMPVTVPPTTLVADMPDIIQRYGFEGYPVVDGDAVEENGRRSVHVDQLRGLITRRQIDRALHHGLATQTIDHFMRTGPAWVTPDQSLLELQRLMIESNWGQIPVADPDTGMIVGIVTRTDLINLWGKPAPTPQREEMAARMETGLPAPLLELLRLAGQAAHDLGCPLYAVGGFVRDLLLGRPNFDVDLVVEGDAIVLARALARQHGGRVRGHQRFGTAKWILPSGPADGAPDDDRPLASRLEGILAAPASLDFVSARTEFYAEPTALPTVEHSSIKLDLHRRDFTINTLAICLNPGRWGELLDFYGGERDLREGLIRVLHTHSFVDDPTRILRAVRFEQRFGFVIEQRTQQLIGDAVALIERITPARIRHELELIFAEVRPEQALRRLEEFGVVDHIHPDLAVDGWVATRFERLRAALLAGSPPADLDQLYFAIWTYRLDRKAIPALDRRLSLMRSTVALLEDLHDLKRDAARLETPGLLRSQVYRLLHPRLEASRWLLRLISDSPAATAAIDLYQRELQLVRPYSDGQDLKRMGLPPGPAYRDVLDAARDAWLDGAITSEAEERARVQALVADRLAAAPASRRSK